MIWLQKLRNQRLHIILRLFLAVPWGCLQFVIVVFPDHTHLLFLLQCIDIKKQPAANIIDGNVQLHVLSHIPDNFQGVTEIVSESLLKPSRVNIVLKKT